MAASALLTALQQTFAATATSGTIDFTALPTLIVSDFLTALGIPTTLSLSGGTGWQQADDGTVSIQTGLQTSVLGVTVPGTGFLIQFTPQGDSYTLLIDLPLPQSWSLGASFPTLQGSFVDEFTIASVGASSLILATGAAADPMRGNLSVAAGVTLDAAFDCGASALSLVVGVLDSPGTALEVCGQITGTASGDGVLNLPAPGTPPTLLLQISNLDWTADNLLGDLDVTVTLALANIYDSALQTWQCGVEFTTSLSYTESGSQTSQSIAFCGLIGDGLSGILDLYLELPDGPLAFPSEDTIAQFLASDQFSANLPSQYQGSKSAAPPLQVIQLGLSVGLNPSVSLVSVTLGLEALDGTPWVVWQNVLSLEDVGFVVAVQAPFSATPSWLLTFTATVTLANTFTLKVWGPVVPLGGISGELVDATSLDLAEAIQALGGPDLTSLSGLDIDTLTFEADVPASTYDLAITLAGAWEITFGDDNSLTVEEMAADLSYASGTVSGTLRGVLALGDATFDMLFEIAPNRTILEGSWVDPAGEGISYLQLAIALGLYGLPDIPESADLKLVEASFELDLSTSTITFTMKTAGGSDAVLIAGDTGSGWGFVYGAIVGLDLTIHLTNIAILSDLVPAGDDVIAISELRLSGGTQTQPTYTPGQFADVLIEPVNCGLALATDLQVGGASVPVNVRFGGFNDNSQYDTPPAPSAPATQPAAQPAVQGSEAVAEPPANPGTGASAGSAAPTSNWITVQRKFGPLCVDKIGLSLDEDSGDLVAAFVGSVTLAGLTIDLIGLTVTIPMTMPPTPSFGLQGLGVTYTGASLSISGALASIPAQDGGKTAQTYQGELSVTAGTTGLTALGSYTVPASGSPSFFAYLMLDDPLGGPPVFFVEGLAAGFGYNQTLTLPTSIDAVPQFPLIAGALGTMSAGDVLSGVQSALTDQPNNQWLAAGVRFSSFEIIDSFALVTATFGPSMVFSLLGVSTLVMPPAAKNSPSTAVTYAELALDISVQPDIGQFAALGQLTPNSYVLEPAAKLTGGFAVNFWWGSSPYAGDFVVTLGGYNASYTPPAQYPQTVPRLGLDWTVSNELTIQGDLYFALTPALVMVGGLLKAAYQSGSLSAWFTAQSDFLCRFEPFSYQAAITVSIGVSYTIHVIVTKTISAQVGVGLQLYGPPFGGTATIDLDVVSATISFGAAANQTPPPIASWAAFRQEFLPTPNASTPQSTIVGGVPQTPTTSLISLGAPNSVLSTSVAGVDWVVNPLTFSLSVTTVAPNTALTLDVGTVTQPSYTPASLGIAPMSVAVGDLTVTLAVTIERNGAVDDTLSWKLAPTLAPAPAALWGGGGTPNLSAASLVANALTGLTLIPQAPTPDQTMAVTYSALVSNDDPTALTAGWTTVAAPTDDDFATTYPDTLSATVITDTIAATATAAARQLVLDELNFAGFGTLASVDLGSFASAAASAFAAEPQLRLLGETA